MGELFMNDEKFKAKWRVFKSKIIDGWRYRNSEKVNLLNTPHEHALKLIHGMSSNNLRNAYHERQAFFNSTLAEVNFPRSLDWEGL